MTTLLFLLLFFADFCIFQLLWNFQRQVQNKKIKIKIMRDFYFETICSRFQSASLDSVHANNVKWALFILRKTYSQKKKQQHWTIPRSFRNSLFYWYVLLWILIFTLKFIGFYLNIYSFKQYQSVFILHIKIK